MGDIERKLVLHVDVTRHMGISLDEVFVRETERDAECFSESTTAMVNYVSAVEEDDVVWKGRYAEQ